MLPKKIYLNYVNEEDDNITWSEEPVGVGDCDINNREYTDLGQVWYSASEEPKIGSNIVAIDKDGEWWDIQPYDGDYDGYGLKGWRCCIRTYNGIQKWTYIEDLLPKE